MIRFSRKQLRIPYLVFLLVFVVLPLFVILYYALTNGEGQFTWENFREFFVDGKTIVNDVSDYSQAPAKTTLSEKLSKDLKKRGFKFTGPVAVLSYLQAAGLVNDHENDCDWKNGD